MDDALRSKQAAADRLSAFGIDGLPGQRVATAVAPRCQRRFAVCHSVAHVGVRSLG